ncbi:hypothetical protein FRC06_007153, partial [Ceratobasidium sp. 370]
DVLKLRTASSANVPAPARAPNQAEARLILLSVSEVEHKNAFEKREAMEMKTTPPLE